jgi:hypothetical protein
MPLNLCRKMTLQSEQYLLFTFHIRNKKVIALQIAVQVQHLTATSESFFQKNCSCTKNCLVYKSCVMTKSVFEASCVIPSKTYRLYTVI